MHIGNSMQSQDNSLEAGLMFFTEIRVHDNKDETIGPNSRRNTVTVTTL